MNLTNIKSIVVDTDTYPLDSEIFDYALLVTVFHEIADKKGLLDEIKRLLKKDGKLLIVEFFKRETPFGPPPAHRLSREEVLQSCSPAGFSEELYFQLGDNFYGVLLSKAPN
jgi:ubiquinone/menaquinone biosynthesis C-methylase UbiE